MRWRSSILKRPVLEISDFPMTVPGDAEVEQIRHRMHYAIVQAFEPSKQQVDTLIDEMIEGGHLIDKERKQ